MDSYQMVSKQGWLFFYNNYRSMPIAMSFQILVSAEQQSRLEKIYAVRIPRVEWKIIKKMEEHMRKIKNLSPPRLSTASQSLPKTPTPPAATVIKKGRKKMLKQQKSIHTGVPPNYRQPAANQPTSVAI